MKQIRTSNSTLKSQPRKCTTHSFSFHQSGPRVNYFHSLSMTKVDETHELSVDQRIPTKQLGTPCVFNTINNLLPLEIQFCVQYDPQCRLICPAHFLNVLPPVVKFSNATVWLELEDVFLQPLQTDLH